MHDQVTGIGLVVAVGVLEEHQVRLLSDVNPAVAEFDSGRDVKLVGENRLFVGFTVAVGILEDQDLVVDRLAGQVHRIRGHRRDPEPPLGVEGHLDRLLEVGKILLRGEQVGLVPFRERERPARFFGRGQVDRLLDVGLDPFESPGVRVVNHLGDGLAFSDGPDPGFAVLDHLAELGELGWKVDDPERGFRLP